MLRVDPTLNHIPARREHVVSLYESINQPLVNIPNHGTAPTGAFLLGTRNEHGYYTVFVYLHQPDTRAVIIYVSEPRSLTAEQFRVEEAEAVRFVESMGFMVDSLHFRQLGTPEQDAIMARIPIFRPPVVTLDLYDVADDPQQRPATDPIFGGMPGGNELFRRAGLSSPPPPPGGQPSHFGGPGSQPQHTPMFGSTTPSALLAQAFPQQAMNSMPPMNNMPPMGGMASTSNAGMAIPGSNPAAPQMPRPDAGLESPEALERLGRLLAAFGVALAVALGGGQACKTTDPEVNPDQAINPHQSLIDIGTQHLAERRWAEAISTFAQVLEDEPKDRDALRGTGLAYIQLGRPADAEPFYRSAIEADPKWSEPKNELAALLIASKRCDEAEALLLTVAQDIFYATPEFAEHNLALALSCLGRSAEAVGRLETALVKRPHFCLGYLTLSQLSLQLGRSEVAVKACEDFDFHCAKNEKIRDQVSPGQSAVCYSRSGKAYMQMGDVESARTSFIRCTQIDTGALGTECKELLASLPE